jgi:hypothetical protein
MSSLEALPCFGGSLVRGRPLPSLNAAETTAPLLLAILLTRCPEAMTETTTNNHRQPKQETE